MTGHEEQWAGDTKAIALAWLETSEGQLYLARVRNEAYTDGYQQANEDHDSQEGYDVGGES